MITINTSKLVFSSVFATLVVGCSTIFAHGPNDDFSWANTGQGNILTNASGMTLYTFDKDSAGKSNCYNQCAVLWPPALVSPHALAEAPYSIVERTDGTQQWAYQGKPLYTWIKDTKIGDTTGDGVKGVWHIIMSTSGY